MRAQSETSVKNESPENAVYLSPMGLAFAVLGLSYERELSTQFRGGASFNVFRSSTSARAAEEWEYKILGSYFFEKSDLNSFWVRGELGLDRNNLDRTNISTVNHSYVSYALLGGYSWNFASHFSNRLGAGISYRPGLTQDQIQPALRWELGMYF